MGKCSTGYCRRRLLWEIYEASPCLKGTEKVCSITVHGVLSDPAAPQLVRPHKALSFFGFPFPSPNPPLPSLSLPLLLLSPPPSPLLPLPSSLPPSSYPPPFPSLPFLSPPHFPVPSISSDLSCLHLPISLSLSVSLSLSLFLFQITREHGLWEIRLKIEESTAQTQLNT